MRSINLHIQASVSITTVSLDMYVNTNYMRIMVGNNNDICYFYNNEFHSPK